MSRKFIPGALALAACGTLALTGTAVAGGDASTKVTINGGGEVFGNVISERPNRCAEGRLVKVFKVRSGKDKYLAEDNAGPNVGNKAQWSVGNLGANGKIYARAPRINGCEPDKSPVVNA